MLRSQRFRKLLSKLPPEQLPRLISPFAAEHPTAARIAAIEELLRASGKSWRTEVGIWIADLLSVEELVPGAYKRWRPLVHHAMAFVASHISDSRLAPKIVEQIELPAGTPAEVRLGKVIAKTPGLQKLGQVLARARGLSPSLRRELQKLENGIADVNAGEIRSIILQQLDRCIDAYQVELASELLCEASVSAIIEFTWLNPATGKREEGVFKVMKPHVPACYAEDLWLLQQLAADLAVRSHEYYFASREVTETLDEVRMLLEREVDFRREQATLAEVGRVYPGSGAHAPRPIPQLCADNISAMSVERGVKVTDAFRDNLLGRRRVATQIVQALIANPIFSAEESAVFHADPHAGNLLYNERKRELIALDWALTGRLSREERRQMARLIVMMVFRDAVGVRSAIHALSRASVGPSGTNAEIIDRGVDDFFSNLPHACSLGAIDAMRLLDHIAAEGVRFPTSLLLMRKVIFTLDGVLADIVGEEIRIDAIIAGEFVSRWMRHFGALPPPFSLADYLAVQRSAFFYATGLWAWAS